MPILDTILLVDDDETTNFLHQRLLKRLQVASNLKVATNGHEALDYLQANCQTYESDSSNCPSLVLLDLKMPVMDGFEFLEQYEKIKDRLTPTILIIVLSSSMNPKDTERIKEFRSVQHHYIKPLSETMVAEIMDQYFPG
jgi:CheY-like chemotaxis protein